MYIAELASKEMVSVCSTEKEKKHKVSFIKLKLNGIGFWAICSKHWKTNFTMT